MCASLAIAVGVSGCGDPPRGRAPVVRIVLDPPFVPEGDGYQTSVAADGSSSSDPFDDPEGVTTFLYHWTIDDNGAVPTPNADSARVEFRVAGARPTAIHLEVVDADGRSATGTVNLGLTISN